VIKPGESKFLACWAREQPDPASRPHARGGDHWLPAGMLRALLADATSKASCAAIRRAGCELMIRRGDDVGETPTKALNPGFSCATCSTS
jgi:hypothetical protein